MSRTKECVMKCKDCEKWSSKVKAGARRRCALAAPIEGKDDARLIAMTMPTDGCAQGEQRK